MYEHIKELCKDIKLNNLSIQIDDIDLNNSIMKLEDNYVLFKFHDFEVRRDISNINKISTYTKQTRLITNPYKPSKLSFVLDTAVRYNTDSPHEHINPSADIVSTDFHGDINKLIYWLNRIDDICVISKNEVTIDLITLGKYEHIYYLGDSLRIKQTFYQLDSKSDYLCGSIIFLLHIFGFIECVGGNHDLYPSMYTCGEAKNPLTCYYGLFYDYYDISDKNIIYSHGPLNYKSKNLTSDCLKFTGFVQVLNDSDVTCSDDMEVYQEYYIHSENAINKPVYITDMFNIAGHVSKPYTLTYLYNALTKNGARELINKYFSDDQQPKNNTTISNILTDMYINKLGLSYSIDSIKDNKDNMSIPMLIIDTDIQFYIYYTSLYQIELKNKKLLGGNNHFIIFFILFILAIIILVIFIPTISTHQSSSSGYIGIK